MNPTANEIPCPSCGVIMSASAVRCSSCGMERSKADVKPQEEALTVIPVQQPSGKTHDKKSKDDEEEAPRRRRSFRKEETIEATDFLVPTNVSAWALASFYLALTKSMPPVLVCGLGFINAYAPLSGLLFSIPAVICGILALRGPRRGASYGSITGKARAIMGLVLGSLGVLIWLGLFLLFFSSR